MNLNDQVEKLSKALVRQHFVFSRKIEELENQIKELDQAAKKLVRRDLELMETNQTLHEFEVAKAKTDAFLGSISDGVISVDPFGMIVFANKEVQPLLDTDVQTLFGQRIEKQLKLIDEQGKEIASEKHPCLEALSQKRRVVGTYLFQKGETRIWLSVSVSPIIAYSKITGAVVIIRDITQEKQIDQAKSEFVSLASHQLRTPLSTINWYAEMLISEKLGPLDKEQKEYLRELYNANQRMVGLVNALLDVSRIELGTFIVEPKPTNIVEIVLTVLKDLHPKIIEKRLSIETHFDKNIPILMLDPKLIGIVFQNLLSNAVKYTPAGKIVISISLRESNIAFSVSDSGYGIPSHQQSKIFTKLFRADNVRMKETEGTGLGLYITKSIVDQSHGKIWFTSQENKGTTFNVSLPLVGMVKKEGTKQLSS